MSLRNVAFQCPIATAVLCAALQFAVTVLILKAGAALLPPAAFGKVKLAAFASTVILPMLLTQLLGLWKEVGSDRIRPTPLFFVSLLTCVLFLAMGVKSAAPGGVAGDFATQLVNAFGEELLFRGVIFAILLTLPTWRAILLSGILFGSMHLIHGFMDGNWPHALTQTLITSVAGFMFAAVRYASRSLWLVIILHMLLNLSMLYSNIEPAAGATALFVVQRLANVFELAVAAWVLLKFDRERSAPAYA